MRHLATYSIAPATQRNFDFSVIFSSEYLVGSEKVLTHTHTHRHLASPNLFLRARGSYANLRKHKGYSYLWCYVFRALSATDIRENKERFYLQNLHDFRAVNCRTSININSRSAVRPHVGTDPVSVRPARQDGMNIWVYNPGYGMRSVARVGMEADRHGVCPYMRAGARVTSHTLCHDDK